MDAGRWDAGKGGRAEAGAPSPEGYYPGDNPARELERVNANASVANLIPDDWMDETVWAGPRNRT